MPKEILKFTKITILIKFLSGLVFTLMYWIPGFSGPLFGLSYSPQSGAYSMMVGSAVLGLTLGAFFALFAKEWKEIKILVIAEIGWLVSVLIAMIVNFSLFDVFVIGVLLIVILLIALYVLSYLQQQDIIKI